MGNCGGKRNFRGPLEAMRHARLQRCANLRGMLRHRLSAWLRLASALLACAGGACSAVVSLDELQQGSGGSGGGGATSSSSSSSAGGGDGGGLSCAPGTEDCEGSGTSCIDLGTTATHCGVCGHDCLGGDCVEGRCLPVLLWDGGETDGRATGIDQSDEYVYATTTLGVVRVPKAGGAPLMLTSESASPRIDVEGAHAYFTAGSLQRVPLGGGSPESLAVKSGWGGRGLRVDATHAYAVRALYTDTTQVELMRVPRNGGSQVNVPLTGTGGWGVQLDAANAYVTGSAGVFRVSKADFASAEQIYAGESGDNLVLLGGNAYLLGAGLWRLDLATAPPGATLLDAELSTGQLASDGERLYYTLFDAGELGRIEFDGTGRVVLADGLVGADVLVIDDAAIYFTHYLEQAIYRLAK